jgi:hypothetical protein
MLDLINKSRVKESYSLWYDVLLDDFEDAFFKEANNLFVTGGSKQGGLAVAL